LRAHVVGESPIVFRLRNVILLWLGRKLWGAGMSAYRRRSARNATR
jgi:hypothetical protein